MTLSADTSRVAVVRLSFGSVLSSSFRAHALFFALIAIYYAFDVELLGSEPGEFLLTMAGSLATGIIMLLIAVAIMRTAIVSVSQRPQSPIRAIASDLRSHLTEPRRLACGLPMLAAFAPVLVIFGEFKAAVPQFAGGFTWDRTFSDFDRWLHFGTYPWEWIQPLVGYPLVTFLLNVNYSFWFFVMWMVWCAWAFAAEPSVHRTRFLLAFVVLWIVAGNLLAAVFSSAGPAYFSRIGLSPDPYAPLMSYLKHADEVYPVWSLHIQDMLWRGFNGRTIVDGISAMPSMHNASAMLFVLAARPFGKLAVRLLSVHMVLIFIGSVALAWHYAIDAYMGWALALIVWFAMKPVAQWWHSRPGAEAFHKAIESFGRRRRTSTV